MTNDELAQIASDAIGVPNSVRVMSISDPERASYAVHGDKGGMLICHYLRTEDGARAFARDAIAWAKDPRK